MARPLRIEFPDAIYQVTSRSNARQSNNAQPTGSGLADCIKMSVEGAGEISGISGAFFETEERKGGKGQVGSVAV